MPILLDGEIKYRRNQSGMFYSKDRDSNLQADELDKIVCGRRDCLPKHRGTRKKRMPKILNTVEALLLVFWILSMLLFRLVSMSLSVFLFLFFCSSVLWLVLN